MIYTCYEMVRDCRANQPEGWRYFVSNYLPVVRRLISHYGAGMPLGPLSALFPDMEPGPERRFVAELRQKVLGGMQIPVPAMEVELTTVAEALEPLTTVEKLASWFETMHYSPNEAGLMLRMAPTTVGKIRERAGELLRGKTDSWNRTLLWDNGLALGRAAAQSRSKDCVAAKVFLDVVDGRTTWRGREEMERHVNSCWHCLDHYCRLLEVIELLRHNQPLSPDETETTLKALR